MPAEEEAAYEVGYGRPPKKTRFVKGRSGNPAGRPRGVKKLLTLLEQTLDELVVVNENGRKKKITKLAAMLKQFTNKATAGDPRSFRLLLDVLRLFAGRVEAPGVTPEGGDEASRPQELKQSYLELFANFSIEQRRELRETLIKAQGDERARAES
jgi:hypothetical protein